MSLTPTNSTHVSPTSSGREVGSIGRLGRWTATHSRAVVAAWVVIAVGFWVFAPRAEKALSGAGWEATGSESVHARQPSDPDRRAEPLTFQPQVRSTQLVSAPRSNHCSPSTPHDPGGHQ